MGEKENGVLWISWHSFARVSHQAIGRNIVREGENIRVVYFNMSKTPWSSIFFDYDLSEIRHSSSFSGSMIYGETEGRLDYELQYIEIYYLQQTNLHRLDRLSNDEFDAKRLNGHLMWRGIN